MPPPGNRLSIQRRLTRGARWLLIASVATFLVFLFAGASLKAELVRWLVLTPGSLAEGHLWKLVTAPVIYPDRAVIELVMHGFLLWMFVPALERWWGTTRFLKFVAATAIAGHLASALVGLALGYTAVPLYGLDPFVWGSIVAFGVLFARHQVSLFLAVQVTGRQLAIGAVALQLLLVLIERRWVSGAGSFAAMGLAWLMTSGNFTPNLWLLKFRRWRVRRKLGVLDGGNKPDKQKWVN
jgi:membrane associated rhomboid family serine protease